MNLHNSFLADILGKIAWAAAMVKGVSSLFCLGNWHTLDDRKAQATLAQKLPGRIVYNQFMVVEVSIISYTQVSHLF